MFFLHTFVDRGNGAIPFHVKYLLPNGLEVSIIWTNSFKNGDKPQFFEVAIFSNNVMIEDRTQSDLDFTCVAKLLDLVGNLTYNVARTLIDNHKLWSFILGYQPE